MEHLTSDPMDLRHELGTDPATRAMTAIREADERRLNELTGPAMEYLSRPRPTANEALQAKYEAVLEENAQLRAQINSLRIQLLYGRS